MKVIIDSNRLIAALIRDNTTRKIILDTHFEFFAPATIKEDIQKYQQEIIQKSELTQKEFDMLLTLFLENIIIIPQEEYFTLLDEVKKDISDVKDTPYLAVCFLIKAEGIWTHDPHFTEQKNFRIFTNIDMLKESEKLYD